MGTWNCYQWDDNGEMNDISMGKVNFTFEQGSYLYIGGQHKEKGTWKIQGRNKEEYAFGLIVTSVML